MTCLSRVARTAREQADVKPRTFLCRNRPVSRRVHATKDIGKMDSGDPFDLFAIPLERPVNSIEEILDPETGLPASWIRILQDQ